MRTCASLTESDTTAGETHESHRRQHTSLRPQFLVREQARYRFLAIHAVVSDGTYQPLVPMDNMVSPSRIGMAKNFHRQPDLPYLSAFFYGIALMLVAVRVI